VLTWGSQEREPGETHYLNVSVHDKRKEIVMNIQEFAMNYQSRFGSNIEFGMASKTGPDHCPVVTVEVFTNFGNFEGKGSNKKVARAKAVEAAAASPDCPF